jgi:signal transduction histidine kinase
LADVAERAVVAALLKLSAIPKDNWEEAMQQILRIDAEVLGVERVSYWTLHLEPALLHCEMGYVALPRAFERGLVLLGSRHPRYFEELAQSTVIEIERAGDDPRTADLHEYLTARNISSMLDVPIWFGGAVVGVLCHEHTGEQRSWHRDDLDFAMGVAQVVAVAIEAHARSQAEQHERQAVFLDQTTRQLSDAFEERVVAARALAIAVPELADWAVLDTVEDGAIARIACAHRTRQGRALLEEMSRRFPPHRGDPHLTARVIDGGQAVVLPETGRSIGHVAVNPEHAALLADLGTRAMIAAPFRVGSGVSGALMLCAGDQRYGQSELRLCEEFARRVGCALQNARLHGQARSAISARDEFIALASHELRAPLASLQLAAESLAKRAESSSEESVVRLSETVVRQTRRMGRLVDHMLDASRVMARRLVIEPATMDLGELVREIARAYRPRLAKAGCALELTAAEPVLGEWDGDRLAQVIGNLLDNAIKFGAGKPIAVGVRMQGEQAVLTVRDRGIGIPADRLGDIFEPFERALAPRSLGGLGLGLFTARAIVEAHGGEIAAASAPHEGTTFTVRLPRRAPASD